MAQTPVGRLEQTDPGQYKDEAGNVWGGNPMKNGAYDPSGLTLQGGYTSTIKGPASTGYDAGGNLAYGSSSAPAPAPTPAPAPAPSAASSGTISPSSTLSVPSVSAPDPNSDPYTQSVRSSILNQIQADQQPVSLSDPQLQPQVSAFATTQQRQLESARDALAERMAASGQLHSGAMDTAANQLEEDAALGRATFNAGLIGNEMNARRTNLGQMLPIAQAGSSQDLSQLFAAAQGNQSAAQGVNQLGVQQALGNSDIALRNKLGTGQLDLGTLQTLLGNQQANNILGFNYANLGANLNRDLILNGILS